MNVSGIKLSRECGDAVVYAEIGGLWVELIREPLDGCFDHIVNESGMEKAAQGSDRPLSAKEVKGMFAAVDKAKETRR